MVKEKRLLEHLIDTLLSYEMDTFFLVTGGAIVPIVDYIGQTKAKYYCFQHEQSAAMAAEGYYRTTGKTPVVLATSGPGAQNLLNGVAGMYYESIPCLIITGQVNTKESLTSVLSHPRQVGFQESPIAETFQHYTKYAITIENPKNFDGIFNKAISSCFEGRRGPVLLDIPINIQNELLINPKVHSYEFFINLSNNSFVEEEDFIQLYTQNISKIKEIKEEIKKSNRPLLLIGHGVKLGRVEREIEDFINMLDIPFVTSWGGFDIISSNHPLHLGDIGVYGKRGANFAIQSCDFLITIGSRLDTRQTGGDLELFSRNSIKVVVDIDKNELNKEKIDINFPIHCDAKTFLSIWGFSSSLDYTTEWKYMCQKF
jgi:acetolactate synthase I/II/III large subunit